MIVKHGRKFKGFTAEGRRVLASSQRMLLEPEMLQQELDSGLGKPRGLISIGAVPTAVPIARAVFRCAQNPLTRYRAKRSMHELERT